MLYIILIAAICAVYFILPLWAQIIVMAVNCLTPDPIPILDEAVMAIGAINKYLRVYRGGCSLLSFFRRRR